MRRVIGIALMLLLSGCASYNAALYGTSEASADWTRCDKDMHGYRMIPDFGITLAKNFSKCMREAGWEQIAGQPEGSKWGPTAYRRANCPVPVSAKGICYAQR